MKSYEIEYGKTAFEYLKDYASIEDKVNLKLKIYPKNNKNN